MDGETLLAYCSITNNAADLFTKALPQPLIGSHFISRGLVPFYYRELPYPPHQWVHKGSPPPHSSILVLHFCSLLTNAHPHEGYWCIRQDQGSGLGGGEISQEAINHVIKRCIEHDCATSAKAGMQGDADKSALGMKRMKTNQQMSSSSHTVR